MTGTRRRAAYVTFIGSGLNTALVSVQAFVLLPMYLHQIGPHLYGAWLAAADILIWLSILDFGIPSVMIQRIAAAHGRGDRRAASEWFFAGSTILLLAGALAAVTGAAAGLVVSGLFGLDPDERQLFQQVYLFAAVAAGISLFVNSFIGLSRAVQETLFMSLVVVVGTLVGFAVSLILLIDGRGLWAAAIGLLVRAVFVLAGGIVFGWTVVGRHLEWPVPLVGRVVREAWSLVPVTTLAGISYSAMNHSEVFLVAALLRPELAVVFSVTRKAAEVGRTLVDTVAFASYGGFSHLVASADRSRARHVYAELVALRTSLAIAVTAAYAAMNASFVALWVGDAYYGGTILTALFGLQLVAAGGSYMLNYLYRAMGHLHAGAGLLLLEAMSRIPLMLALLTRVGLPGLPLAATISAVVALPITHRVILRDLPGASRANPRAWWVWAVRLSVLGTAIVAGATIRLDSWIQVIGFSVAISTAVGLAFLRIDQNLRELRHSFASHLGSLYSSTRRAAR